LKRREPVFRRKRDEANLPRIVEDCGRDRAAKFYVEPGPVALRISDAESCESLIRAAKQDAALPCRIEARLRCRSSDGEDSRNTD
jgi:hypothetical protein